MLRTFANSDCINLSMRDAHLATFTKPMPIGKVMANSGNSSAAWLRRRGHSLMARLNLKAQALEPEAWL